MDECDTYKTLKLYISWTNHN